MFRRPPKLQADYAAAQVVRFIFGSSNWPIVLPVILFFFMLEFVSNSIYDMATGNFRIFQWIGVLFFLLSIVLLMWLARKKIGDVNLLVRQDEMPQKCRALIVFLSPPGADIVKVVELENKDVLGRIGDLNVRSMFSGPWRMPLEAICYHLERLRRVIIIPSADSPGKEDGTFRNLALFRSFARTLVGTKEQVEFVSSGEINHLWEKGVDFEDAQSLVDAVTEAYDWLRDRKITDNEIMVDVTGGQKVPTVAGAAVALGEGRRFQYVSTRDFKLRAYDIRYG